MIDKRATYIYFQLKTTFIKALANHITKTVRVKKICSSLHNLDCLYIYTNIFYKVRTYIPNLYIHFFLYLLYELEFVIFTFTCLFLMLLGVLVL